MFTGVLDVAHCFVLSLQILWAEDPGQGWKEGPDGQADGRTSRWVGGRTDRQTYQMDRTDGQKEMLSFTPYIGVQATH